MFKMAYDKHWDLFLYPAVSGPTFKVRSQRIRLESSRYNPPSNYHKTRFTTEFIQPNMPFEDAAEYKRLIPSHYCLWLDKSSDYSRRDGLRCRHVSSLDVQYA